VVKVGRSGVAGEERVEQPAASSCAPGSRCPYTSSVIAMPAWPMYSLSAFAFTPAAIIRLA